MMKTLLLGVKRKLGFTVLGLIANPELGCQALIAISCALLVGATYVAIVSPVIIVEIGPGMIGSFLGSVLIGMYKKLLVRGRRNQVAPPLRSVRGL